MRLSRKDILFLGVLYLVCVAIRLLPRLSFDPHLLTFDADIWYRLCLAQFVLENGYPPQWDIRYQAYGHVPFWYTPLALYIYAFLGKLTALDLPTVTSRIMPWIESTAILPFYFLCRYLYSARVAVTASLCLAFTPAFLFWSAIGTPQGFSMFCIPLGILLWVTFVRGQYLAGRRLLHFVIFALLLTVNFLTHLTYFNHIIILLLVHWSLIVEKKGKWTDYGWLVGAILLSQLATVWWWLPGNLYWWWTQGLSTSTASADRMIFLKHYGTVSGFLGHAAFFYLVYFIFRRRHKKELFYLLPVFWAIYPIVESHMEGLLIVFQKQDLSFNNLVRPIEGFRFYSFLAQPLALCVALTWEQILKARWPAGAGADQRRPAAVFAVVLAALLLVDLYAGFKINARFKTHWVTLNDIRTAYWFREHSRPGDRLVADYFTAQMISGVCTGKALLGSMFPLKGAGLPYISDSWRVLHDIHTLYKSEDIATVRQIMGRYGITHVFYSDEVLRKIEWVLNGYGDKEGYLTGKYDVLLDVAHEKTLLNPRHFRSVHESGGVRILALQPE